MKALKTVIANLMPVVRWITAGLFIGVFGLNVVQITLRYLVGTTWLWVPDLLRLMFVWMVFLGASVLYAMNGHLAVDFLVTRLSPRRRQIAAIVVEAAAITFFTILFFKGIEIAEKRMRVPFDTWDVPTGYAYAAISVAAVLMLLIGIDRLADQIRTVIRGETENVEGN